MRQIVFLKAGYFHNELFMKQVEKAISILEAKYPKAKGLSF